MFSQQPVPDRLRLRVSRISMHDYEALHYDKEKLREACEYCMQITCSCLYLKFEGPVRETFFRGFIARSHLLQRFTVQYIFMSREWSHNTNVVGEL